MSVCEADLTLFVVVVDGLRNIGVDTTVVVATAEVDFTGAHSSSVTGLKY